MKKVWSELNLSQLKYFVDSVSMNSLTKAAEVNFISRPAVSQAIRRLEDILGYTLLDHKKKHLILTSGGHKFFLRGKQILELLNHSLDEPTESSGSFRIGCSATLAEHLVLPFLQKQALKVRKKLKVDIKIGTTSRVRELVADGQVSMGLLIDDEMTQGFDTAIIRKGEFEFQSRSGKFELPLFTTELRPEVITGLKALPKLDDGSNIQIESWAICRKAALQIGGMCLVPDIMAKSELIRVSIKRFQYKYQILAITMNKNHLSDLENEFFEGRQS